MKTLAAVFLSLLTLTGYSQMSKKVSWSTSVSSKEVKVGDTVELIFKGKIEDDWYLYSSDFDPDLGPIVATFNFAESDAYELVGDITPVGRKEKMDTEIWNGKYTYFTGTAEFRQKVRILKENPVIQVKLNGQVCSEVSGACIPVIESFKFDQIKAVPAATGNAEPTGQKNDNQDSNEGTGEKMRPETEKINPCTAGDLKCLQEQRQKTYGKNGKDEAREQLTEFVRKYGN